jgi:nitrogenase molybdenum-iron protein alpha/beta subunit
MPDRPCAVVEMPSLSRSFAEGYQQGIRAYLEAQPWASRPVRPRTVALIGLSIAHAQWEGSVLELTRLLALCGLEVVCALGAGADLAACRALAEAEVLAVVHDTYADRLLPWLRKQLPGTVATSPSGAPVGFAATEAWIRAVTTAAAVDPSPALEDLIEHRRRVARMLNLASGSVDTLRGSTFALKLDIDLAAPLARWLYDYLGLLPAAIQCPTDPAGHLEAWLKEIGCPEAWGSPCEHSDADLLLADGPTCALAQMHGLPALPFTFPVDPVPPFLPDPILGVRGAVRLVEQVARLLLG